MATTDGSKGITPEEPNLGTYKDGPGFIDPTKNSVNEDILYFRQKYKSNMFTVADGAMALNIYPGAILSGKSLEGVFDPKILEGISNNMRPITISTSMPTSGSVVANTSLPRPSSGNLFLNSAISDLESENPNGIGAASLIVEIDSFNVYEELKTLYGYNKGVDIFFINTNAFKKGENHYITSTSGLKLKFLVQIPIHPRMNLHISLYQAIFFLL